MKTEVEPVAGAARYQAHGNQVWMLDTDGYDNHIDTKRTPEQAIKSAEQWQKKENRAVLKSKGQI